MDPKMFRYSTERYNRSLLSLGCIRVGTLYDFRQSEHKKGIADPNEGTKTVGHHINNLYVPHSEAPPLKENKDFRALSIFQAIDLTESTGTSITNFSVSQSFDMPNCFILCTSRSKSKNTMSQFEGADSCVEIRNIVRFYQLLTLAICDIIPVTFCGIHEVTYQNRQENWNGTDWGHHPSIIKEVDFHQQNEIRAIWQPKLSQPIQPLIISYFLLGSCVESVSV